MSLHTSCTSSLSVEVYVHRAKITRTPSMHRAAPAGSYVRTALVSRRMACPSRVMLATQASRLKGKFAFMQQVPVSPHVASTHLVTKSSAETTPEAPAPLAFVLLPHAGKRRIEMSSENAKRITSSSGSRPSLEPTTVSL